MPNISEHQLRYIYDQINGAWEVLGFDHKDLDKEFAKHAVKTAETCADNACIEILKVFRGNNLEK